MKLPFEVDSVGIQNSKRSNVCQAPSTEALNQLLPLMMHLLVEIFPDDSEHSLLLQKQILKTPHFQACIQMIVDIETAQQMPRRVSATHIILNLPKVVSISENFYDYQVHAKGSAPVLYMRT
jgi:hypothetical protein